MNDQPIQIKWKTMEMLKFSWNAIFNNKFLYAQNGMGDSLLCYWFVLFFVLVFFYFFFWLLFVIFLSRYPILSVVAINKTENFSIHRFLYRTTNKLYFFPPFGSVGALRSIFLNNKQ